MLNRKVWLGFLSAVGIGFANGLVAQTLEEVVVTAQKRAESLSDVPISISAVAGESLEKQSIDSLTTLSQSIPNVNIYEGAIDSTIQVRGVTTGNNKGFEQSVVLYFDGVPYGRSQLVRTPLVDLERVEILRGPQPTIFGKNAIAGAISVISAKPTDEFESKLSVSHEYEHDESQVLGVVSGPLSDSVNGRLTMSYRDMDGWVNNVQQKRLEPQREESYVRAQLAWDVNDDLAMNFKLETADFDSLGYSMENLRPQGGFGSVFAGPIAVDITEDWQRASGDVFSKNSMENFVLTADYNWNEISVTTTTAYVEYDTSEVLDVDYQKNLILDGTSATEAFEQFSQEIRFASPDGERFDYIGGVFFQTEDIVLTDDVPLGPFLALAGPPVSSLNGTSWARDYEQSSDRWSIFAQGDYEISQKLKLTVGARYSKEDKDAKRKLALLGTDGNAASAQVQELWAQVLNVYPHDISGNRDENSFDPLIRLQYRANDDLAFHVSYTEGSKAGGFDIRSNSAPGTATLAGRPAGTFEFDDEQAENIELGVKYSSDRAQANLTLFKTDYTNQQTSIFDGTLSFFVGNVSASELEGVELDGRFLLTEGLEFYASAAHIDFSYTDFKTGRCGFRETSNAGGYCDRTGYTAPWLPETTANFGVDYETNLSSGLVVDMNINANHSSSYLLSPNHDSLHTQGSYTKIGAHIGLSGDDGAWRVSLIADNLTDERIKVAGADLPLTSTFVDIASEQKLDGIAYYSLYQRPRNVTLKLDYNF
jgi:outer membrane receptor protein involved in Fe transport